ncbi:MAG: L-serine ammonia-lyase, iron-sulfur-dependent, subunit alpha [Phycisphaerae bacterium]|nr:L-serine ammonia-lyase, iron-sulfur-dependent, subunit alpha [Phycisphaerae bacterium]
MRGPSSSHCAAAIRIGRIARDLMDNNIKDVLVQYDIDGSLATTHKSQGSDMGLMGGLMGMDTIDDQLVNSETLIKSTGVRVEIQIKKLNDPHPNTYRLTLSNDTQQHCVQAISTGGGMIEIINIDDTPIKINGDYWETLLFINEKANEQNILNNIHGNFNCDEILAHNWKQGRLIQIKSQKPMAENLLESLHHDNNITYIKAIAPVLSILSGKNISVPFNNCQEMLDYANGKNLSLWQLAVEYESQRGNISSQEVINRMTEIVRIVKQSIAEGIKGTKYHDRILGHQCGKLKEKIKTKEVLNASLTNQIILYVSALMEIKSSMGIIVAAPTAGSCAALPGSCLAIADAIPGTTDEDVAKAMLAGGLIGIFITNRSTFAAEEAGCQAECGSASGMAAAAMVSLAHGTTQQAIAAATMALQNSLGMVCDPVANRVEVPCLGKNVMAAVNALACANMALADYDPVTTLDEVIEAMDQVGRKIPREFRCTALGGLSICQSSKNIEKKLSSNNME